MVHIFILNLSNVYLQLYQCPIPGQLQKSHKNTRIHISVYTSILCTLVYCRASPARNKLSETSFQTQVTTLQKHCL